MTAGDIKGEEAIVAERTLGATTTAGQVVHYESDGKWDPVIDSDTGPFGVAIDAGGDTETARVVIFGRVEVTNGSTTAIPKGAPVMAYTAGTVMLADTAGAGEVAGIATEAIGASGAGTVWFGLGTN